MGIFHSIVEHFQAAAPITGDVLTIGRQKIHRCCQPINGKTYNDISLFKMLGARTVRAVDVSDYEGAEIIHDLHAPIPDSLAGIADFIYDGSSLDNIWDPAQAIRNISRMLRPNGRVMMLNVSASWMGAYVALSPEWFFNFFAANDYERCSLTVFQIQDRSWKATFKPWVAHPWHCFDDDGKIAPTTPADRIAGLDAFYTFVSAQKGPNSTDDKSAVQAAYRAPAEQEKFRQAQIRFKSYE